MDEERKKRLEDLKQQILELKKEAAERKRKNEEREKAREKQMQNLIDKLNNLFASNDSEKILRAGSQIKDGLSSMDEFRCFSELYNSAETTNKELSFRCFTRLTQKKDFLESLRDEIWLNYNYFSDFENFLFPQAADQIIYFNIRNGKVKYCQEKVHNNCCVGMPKNLFIMMNDRKSHSNKKIEKGEFIQTLCKISSIYNRKQAGAIYEELIEKKLIYKGKLSEKWFRQSFSRVRNCRILLDLTKEYQYDTKKKWNDFVEEMKVKSILNMPQEKNEFITEVVNTIGLVKNKAGIPNLNFTHQNVADALDQIVKQPNQGGRNERASGKHWYPEGGIQNKDPTNSPHRLYDVDTYSNLSRNHLVYSENDHCPSNAKLKSFVSKEVSKLEKEKEEKEENLLQTYGKTRSQDSIDKNMIKDEIKVIDKKLIKLRDEIKHDFGWYAICLPKRLHRNSLTFRENNQGQLKDSMFNDFEHYIKVIEDNHYGKSFGINNKDEYLCFLGGLILLYRYTIKDYSHFNDDLVFSDTPRKYFEKYEDKTKFDKIK